MPLDSSGAGSHLDPRQILDDWKTLLHSPQHVGVSETGARLDMRIRFGCAATIFSSPFMPCVCISNRLVIVRNLCFLIAASPPRRQAPFGISAEPPRPRGAARDQPAAPSAEWWLWRPTRAPPARPSRPASVCDTSFRFRLFPNPLERRVDDGIASREQIGARRLSSRSGTTPWLSIRLPVAVAKSPMAYAAHHRLAGVRARPAGRRRAVRVPNTRARLIDCIASARISDPLYEPPSTRMASGPANGRTR